MNIAIYSKNVPNAYSGGRYHALMLAVAAAKYHKVYYVSNIEPIFLKDFEYIQLYHKVTFIFNKDFIIEKNIKFDIVIIIPDLDTRKIWFEQFYLNILKYAYKNRSKIIFLNFETPNWFNEVSAVKKELKLWKYWLKTSYYCDAILSSANISTLYAKQYFSNHKLNFYTSHPAINQVVADIYKNKITKKNEIITFARFFSEHKGSYKIFDLISSKLSGYTIKIIIGDGSIPEDFKKQLIKKAKSYNINIKFLFKLSDNQKFKEIASSKFLLFLSDFEGFGYPPVESLYMGIPVIAFYLDVLYEVSGDNIIYIKNIEEFNKLDLEKIANKKVTYNKNIEIESFSNNLNKIFLDIKKKKGHSFIQKFSLFCLVAYYKIMSFIPVLQKIPRTLYKKYYFNSKLKLLNETKDVLIFGIGEYSKVWTQWCNNNNKNIIGYIVSKKEHNSSHLKRPVFSIDEIGSYKTNTIFIIATISPNSANEIMDYFENIKSKNIFFCSNTQDFSETLTNERIVNESLEIIFDKKISTILS